MPEQLIPCSRSKSITLRASIIIIICCAALAPMSMTLLPAMGLTSLLLYEAYANESSQICPFLALRPEFHSNLRVILSTPRYCQSAAFGRLTCCVYILLFFIRNSRSMSPRPPRARHAHRANRSATREAYMLNYNEQRQ